MGHLMSRIAPLTPGATARQSSFDEHRCKLWRTLTSPVLDLLLSSPDKRRSLRPPFSDCQKLLSPLLFPYKPQREENHRGEKSLKSALEMWLRHFSFLFYFLTRQIYSSDKHVLKQFAESESKEYSCSALSQKLL